MPLAQGHSRYVRGQSRPIYPPRRASLLAGCQGTACPAARIHSLSAQFPRMDSPAGRASITQASYSTRCTNCNRMFNIEALTADNDTAAKLIEKQKQYEAEGFDAKKKARSLLLPSGRLTRLLKPCMSPLGSLMNTGQRFVCPSSSWVPRLPSRKSRNS